MGQAFPWAGHCAGARDFGYGKENHPMNHSQREERRRQEDIALNRGLVWVGVAIVLELFLVLVNRYYINITTAAVGAAQAFHTCLRLLRTAAPIAALACAAWAWAVRKKKSVLPGSLCVICAAVAFIAHISLVFNAAGVRMLLMLVPACAALALAFYLYQREFFWSTAFTGMGVVALWMIRHRGPSTVTLYLALFYAALVCAAVVLITNRGGRPLKIGRLELWLQPKGAGWRPIGVTLILAAAAVAVALASNITVAYYLIYVLVAWVFGLLVYFTVKMM